MDDRQVKRRRIEAAEGEGLPIQARSCQYGDASATGHSMFLQGDHHGPVVQNHYYGRSADQTISQSEADRVQKLVESLTFERMDARQHNVKAAMPQTCTWLFRHKHFKAWMSEERDDQNGFLWIKGKPGCGKSTIMKNTLRHVSKTSQKLPIQWTVLSYFFNARAPESLEKSALGLYRSVVHSLLTAIPALKSVFYNTFSWKLRSDVIDDWTEEELQNFLVDIIQDEAIALGPLCIFIDALDEGEENDIRQMISFLDDLASHAVASNCDLRICFSSRHYPQIVITHGLSLTVEDEAEHDADIELYIRRKLLGASAKNMSGIRDEIFRKSAKIFLWVVLVIRILNAEYTRARTVEQMKCRLNEIPPDLDGLFVEILRKSLEDIYECVLLLQWVLFAFRPLKAAELYCAIRSSHCTSASSGTPDSSTTLGDLDELERYLLNASRGLIELTKSKSPVVQFIHETVRAFLISPKGLQQIDSTLSANVGGLSHHTLKVGCFRYIESCCISSLFGGCRRIGENQADFMKRLAGDFPFLEYSLNKGYVHADKAHANGIQQDVFLSERTDGEGCWNDPKFMEWWNQIQHYGTRKYALKEIPLVYFLADQNLPALLDASIQAGMNVNARGGRFGTALQAACVGGYTDVVERLLRSGVDVNARGGEHGHAIIAAILSKRFEIARLLEHNESKPDGPLLGRALMTAISRKSTEAMKMLLDMGANANYRNIVGESPIAIAIRNGYVEGVETLLAKHANANETIPLRFPESRVVSVLCIASKYGYLEMVKSLLAAGAILESPGDRDPIAAAVEGGHIETAAFLYEQGNFKQKINEELKGRLRRSGSALCLAACEGRCDMVKWLIEAGAIMRPEEVSYAISHGSGKGFPFTSCFLLEHATGEGLTIPVTADMLCNAAQFDSPALIAKLIDLGGDVDAHSSGGSTALLVSAYRGHLSNVKTLLDGGANVNKPGSYLCYEYAVAAAAANGRSDMVELLLANGADVNLSLVHKDSLSPLAAAARCGLTGCIRILMKAGAGITQNGLDENMWASAIQEAKSNMAVEVLQQGYEEAKARYICSRST